MAIRNPNFQQTSTRVGPDTSTAELIGGLGQAGTNLLAGAVRNRVNADLQGLQNELLTRAEGMFDAGLQGGTDPQQLVDLANAQRDVIAMAEEEAGAVRTNQGEVTPALAGILTDYDNQLSRMQQMQAQGAMSQAEFDIRARSIRKRMVDRYPGLTPEIDRVWQNHTQYDEGYIRAVMALEAQAEAQKAVVDARESLRTHARKLNVPDYLMDGDATEQAMFLRMYANKVQMKYDDEFLAGQVRAQDNLAILEGRLGPTQNRDLLMQRETANQNFVIEDERNRYLAVANSRLHTRVMSEAGEYTYHLIDRIRDGSEPMPGVAPPGMDFDTFLGTHEGIVWLRQQGMRYRQSIIDNIRSDPATAVVWDRMPDHARREIMENAEGAWEQHVAFLEALNPEARADYLQNANELDKQVAIRREINALGDDPRYSDVQIAMDPARILQIFASLPDSVQKRLMGRRAGDELLGGILRQIAVHYGELEAPGAGQSGARFEQDTSLLSSLPALEDREAAVTAVTEVVADILDLSDIGPEVEGSRAVIKVPFGVRGESGRSYPHPYGEQPTEAARSAAVFTTILTGMVTDKGKNHFGTLGMKQQNEMLDVIGDPRFPEMLRGLAEREPAAVRAVIEWDSAQAISNALNVRAASLASSGTSFHRVYNAVGADLFNATWDAEIGAYRMTLKDDALQTAKAAAAANPQIERDLRRLLDSGTGSQFARAGGLAGPALGRADIPHETGVSMELLTELERRANMSQRNVGRTVRAAYNLQPAHFMRGAEGYAPPVPAQSIYDGFVANFDPVLRAQQERTLPPLTVSWDDLPDE